MHRSIRSIQSYQHMLVSSAQDVAVYRQLKKLEQKKFHLLRRINRLQHLADKDNAELKQIDTKMEQLQVKVKSTDG